MKNPRIFICLISVFISLSIFFSCAANTDKSAFIEEKEISSDKFPKAGGPCIYDTLKGRAEILETGEGYRENGINRYETTFIFRHDEKTDTAFLMIDGNDPDSSYIMTNRIKPGRRGECLKISISEGTCTPVIWEFSWPVPKGDD